MTTNHWQLKDLQEWVSHQKEIFEATYKKDSSLLLDIAATIDEVPHWMHQSLNPKASHPQLKAELYKHNNTRIDEAWSLIQIQRASEGDFSFTQDDHSDQRAEIAWVWSELTAEEKSLAKTMPPSILSKWLMGSFEVAQNGFERSNSNELIGYGGAHKEGFKRIKMLDPQWSDLRRVHRAMKLCEIRSRDQWWRPWMAFAQNQLKKGHEKATWNITDQEDKSDVSLTHCLKERHERVKSIFKEANKQLPPTQKKKGLMVFSSMAIAFATAGASSMNWIPDGISSPAVISTYAVFVGIVIKVLGVDEWKSTSLDSYRSSYETLWQPGFKKLLEQTYPDFAKEKLIDQWGQSKSLYDGVESYAGLSFLGYSEKDLDKNLGEDTDFGFSGKPDWTKQDLVGALQSLFEAQEIKRSIDVHPSSRIEGMGLHNEEVFEKSQAQKEPRPKTQKHRL